MLETFPRYHWRLWLGSTVVSHYLTGTEIFIFLSCYLSTFVSCLAHDGSIWSRVLFYSLKFLQFTFYHCLDETAVVLWDSSLWVCISFLWVPRLITEVLSCNKWSMHVWHSVLHNWSSLWDFFFSFDNTLCCCFCSF